MSISLARPADLRMADLVTFLEVRRTGSITGAARALRVTASQVSKAVARVERHTRVRLLSRGGRGITLSEEGSRLLPNIEAALDRIRQLRAPETMSSHTDVTVAAPSYLIVACLPQLAEGDRSLRVRGIELPPSMLRARASEDFFEIALFPGAAPHLPTAWSTEVVGQLRMALFSTPKIAASLGKGPVSVDSLRRVPFVTPLFTSDGRFVPVDDDCPLTRSERIAGHEAQTFSLALELAARTDELVFGPVIAATRHVASGALVEIAVNGWDVREDLVVAINGDRVLARVRTRVLEILSRFLRET